MHWHALRRRPLELREVGTQKHDTV
jgi:hypothetical protein